ncbi:fimbrillin family protein [Prevotella communis]|uniref:fimbrillin family protein n=1 Tax=Prevotella communis TaxID=2913614 RepID=UPI001EDADF8F|nr:fimbrillin family protein [Prevotella communis]UKK59875.1 fimbrillin family protein [Prevotella communis]
MMKKVTIFAAIAMTMVGCSSDELVNNSTENNEAPIAFSVEKKNISRGTALENLGHYNFGVWAYKYKDGLTTQKVMDNYLVGYSNETIKKGYEHSGSTTWASAIGSETDHTSPWFYENLGTSEYKYVGTDGYYTKNDGAYMSANANQYLRYWDLAYKSTNFYAYAPYRATGVTFDENAKKITVANTAQVAGYDNPSLQEFMYAGAQATNAELKDVKLNFKHLGAQVNLRFYEDVRGYRVEIIDVTDAKSGIQATPATKSGDTYTKADYYTSCGATIDFTNISTPAASVNHTDAEHTQNNLKFLIPAGTKDDLTTYTSKLNTNYNVIPEAVTSGTQNYAKSSTVYYPVAQPENSEVGFTFHVSYKLIAEDNGEEVTVHNARVYVPAKNGSEFIAAWQPNTKYTYTFKITKDSKGTTNPNDTTIDITNPDVPADPTVYPIVFDGATVEDYTIQENGSNF